MYIVCTQFVFIYIHMNTKCAVSPSNHLRYVENTFRPSEESLSGEYHMYQVIPLHSCDYLYQVSIKINVATDKGNSRNELWHWTSRWDLSRCTNLSLSASWTHGLIAQSVRASEWNSVAKSCFRPNLDLDETLAILLTCKLAIEINSVTKVDVLVLVAAKQATCQCNLNHGKWFF